MRQKKYWTIIIILALSFLTHFAYFGRPNQTVFDEVHFGKFLSGYLTGEYFFDIHPPLGKLLLSGAGYLSGFKPGFSFANIGETFPDKQYQALRLLPALAGFLLPLIIYFLSLRLGFSRRGALLASLFITFENALNIQSRFILLDSFLLLFGFSSLLFYLKSKKACNLKPITHNLLLSGIFGGMASSVKWTGGTFLAVIVILEFINLVKHPRASLGFKGCPWIGWTRNFRPANLKLLAIKISSLIVAPVLIYTGTFALHFSLLKKSGPGNVFMTPSFQKTLSNSHYQNDDNIKPIGFIKKFSELNTQMYLSNKGISAQHPYGSKWYSWPFSIRPVYFWNRTEAPGEYESKIYLLGNPFVWWSSTIAILLLLINFTRNLIKRLRLNFTEKFILFGFFINLLPFVGITRVMFVYHYFTSLVFAILALAYLVDKTNKKSLFALFAFFAILFFFFFSAFTYGFPLTPQEQNLLFWLPTWR